MTSLDPAWAWARRVLCVRLDSMGDVLMTGPAMRALKESVPGRRLTLLTSAAGAAAGQRLPFVDALLVHAAPWMKSPVAPNGHAAIVRELQSRHFDAAVIFTLHTQSPLPAALLCWWAGIPLVAARCRENPYHLLSTWLPEDEVDGAFRHDVERQLSLAAATGASTDDRRLTFQLDRCDREAARAVLAENGIDGRPWCLIHPGASAPSRRYPPMLFAAAVRMLVERAGWRIIVAGGPGEQALVQDVALLAGPGATPLPQLELGTLAALAEAAPVVIANNSGPAHLAAAVGTPVVDLYALTNPQHAPWGVPHRLLSHDVECRFCYRSVCPQVHHRCLQLVPPEDVATAARELAAPRLATQGSTEVPV